MVVFLILMNFSVWVMCTFGLQKPWSTVLELGYYSNILDSTVKSIQDISWAPWIVIQRILLPIVIFFRFHSLVLLVEFFKNSYRSEEIERFTVTAKKGNSKMEGCRCW